MLLVFPILPLTFFSPYLRPQLSHFCRLSKLLAMLTATTSTDNDTANVASSTSQPEATSRQKTSYALLPLSSNLKVAAESSPTVQADAIKYVIAQYEESLAFPEMVNECITAKCPLSSAQQQSFKRDRLLTDKRREEHLKRKRNEF